MKTYVISPWVVRNNQYYLGAKLRAVKAPLENLHLLSKENLDYLARMQFVVDIESMSLHEASSVATDEDEVCDKQNCCWLWVTDENLLELAYGICESLNSKSTDFIWRVTSSKESILLYLQQDNQRFCRSVIIPFSNTEPISDRAIQDKFIGLSNIEILWMGECLEGLHVGPIVQSIEQLDNYKKCTQEWSSAKTLFNLGFKDYWPLSLQNAMVEYKENFVKAILKIIKPKTYSGNCILIEGDIVVNIWTTLKDFSISEDVFLNTQIWSKGLIKSYKTSQLEPFKNVFIAEGFQKRLLQLGKPRISIGTVFRKQKALTRNSQNFS